MSISVLVDEHLLEQAMQATHVQNSQILVEKALSLLIQSQKQDSLVGFFQKSPLVGIDLEIERNKDTGRDVDL